MCIRDSFNCVTFCAGSTPTDADQSISDPVAESSALTSAETSHSSVPVIVQKSGGLLFAIASNVV